VLFFVPVVVEGQQLPDWTGKIRRDHPRLFFNAQTWPAVKQRALGAEHDWYRRVKSRIDGLLAKAGTDGEPEPQNLGPEAAAAAFVFLMAEDPRYLDLGKRCLRASVAYYELFDARGLPHGKPFAAQAEGGPRPASFNLVSPLYHISGATSFTFECPHGIDDPRGCRVSLEQILEIRLTLYEAMMQLALDAKQRPTGG
jgi:hypothetical protein